MESWLVDQDVHFASAVKRLGVIPFINDWKAAGGGVLDMKVAPFKLMAIVNRMDLHDAIGYGGGSSGETRFVYALMDSACNPMPFLVIFEYGNTARKCDDHRSVRPARRPGWRVAHRARLSADGTLGTHRHGGAQGGATEAP